MSDILFWASVVLYWAIAIKRMPTYFKRWYEYDQEEWGSIHDEEDSQKAAAWITLGLMFVWPFYEGGRWLRDHIVSSMTREERKEAEYTKAAKIVEDYKLQQEKADREAFDKALKEE